MQRAMRQQIVFRLSPNRNWTVALHQAARLIVLMAISTPAARLQ
jgi:hypothetical protein